MNRDRFRRTSGPLSVETTGKSVDDAVQAALGRLRARRDEVDIEVIEEGSRGFFGLGSKEARVRVRRRGTGPESRGGRTPGGREDREGRSPRGDREERRPEGRHSRDDRDGRGGRDSRDSRDGRDRRDGRDSRDSREPRDSRDVRDSREPRESREPRDSRDSRGSREGREGAARDEVARTRARSIPAVRAKEELDRLENELRVRRETRRQTGSGTRGRTTDLDDNGDAAPAARRGDDGGDPRRRRRRSRRPGGDGVNLETIGADPVEIAPEREEPPRVEARPPADRTGGGRGPDRRRRVDDERAVTVVRASGVKPEGDDEEIPSGPRPDDYPDPQELATFAQELLQRMGIAARVDAGWGGDAYELKIEAGENDTVLIGRRGETLDALQHVFAKMVSRGREELLRVRVDVSEYRQKHSSELAEHALELARQVRETGREIITEPMPAADRRIIHRTLSEFPDVATLGLGDGHEKPVWIGPAGQEPEERASRSYGRESRGGRRGGPRGGRDRGYSSGDPGDAGDAGGSTDDLESTGVAVGQGDGQEPLSLIDPWDGATPKPSATPEASEWGRRPKPARGRRR